MGKRRKALLIAGCALVVLLVMGGGVFVVERQGDKVAQTLRDAIAKLDLHRAKLILFEGSRDSWFYFDSACFGIDSETREVDVLIRIRPNIYSINDFTSRFYLNGERLDVAWDDEAALLTARAKLTLGAEITESRLVVEDKEGNWYQQQAFLNDNDRPIEFPFWNFAPSRSVFHDTLKERWIENNTFNWNSNYTVITRDLPFGSKMASARVYAYDVVAEKEMFSQELEDGKIIVDHTIRLTPGKTRLRLYGEITGQEGMRYRYFLGEVLQANGEEYPWREKGKFYITYPTEGIPLPLDDNDTEERYNLHAIFPDQTTLGLKTY